jgi:hypothetical protein
LNFSSTPIALQQPVVAFRRRALEEAICLAAAPDAVDNLGAAVRIRAHHLFYRRYVVLEIGVDADQYIARSCEQSSKDGALLTEVPGQLQAVDAGVLGCQAFDDAPGAVGRAIVDEEDRRLGYRRPQSELMKQMDDSPLVRDEAERGGEHSETVLHAALEVDGGGFFKYFVGQEISPMLKAEHDGLGDHLVVEDEIVGVFEQRKGLQQFAREGAEAGVVLGELDAEKRFWNAVRRRLAMYL